MHLGEELVVGGGEASLAGHVHYEDGLATLVSGEGDGLPADVLGLQLEEGFRDGAELLLAGFLRQSTHYITDINRKRLIRISKRVGGNVPQITHKI